MVTAATTWLCHYSKNAITDNKYVNKQLWLCSSRTLSMNSKIRISCNFHISQNFLLFKDQTVGRICVPDSESDPKLYVSCPQKKEKFKHTPERVVLHSLFHYSVHNYQSYIRSVTFLLKSRSGTPRRYCRFNSRPPQKKQVLQKYES